MLEPRTFRIPPTLIIGSGASKQVEKECKKLGVEKGLIVTDKALIELGILEGVKESLSKGGIEFVIYDKVSTEPIVDFVQEGLEISKENSCDFLLAVGGGSCIDVAKAIGVMATNPGSIQDYMGFEKFSKKGLPVIAVPTTGGTGSEATMVTIVTDTETNVKMLIGSSFLIPQVAIIDPLLSLSVPRNLTAATGIDALTHAIEAYISVKAQPLTDIFALSALKLISGNIRQAWANGDNLEARSNMMLGALQAGIAFSNSSVALVHGMSRPLGAYFHIPHGVSNATLLPIVTEFSIMGNPERYSEIANIMGENTEGLSPIEGASLAVQAIKRLNENLKIPSIRELGVDKEKFEEVVSKMAEDAIASGSPANNPRKPTKEEIIELYKKAF